MGNNQIPEAASGLYTGPSEDSFKPTTPEIKPEPVVSSQNEIDLSQYREKLVPTKSTVEKNWANGFNDSPSLVMAQEIKHRVPSEPKAPDVPKTEETIEKPDTSPYDIVTGSGYDDPKKPETPKKPFFDLEFGSDEEIKKRDLHQEALDRNKKANEGFTGKGFSQTGRNALNAHDTIADLAKENATLGEQNAELKARLENIESMLEELKLQNALDPRQRTSNPLEEVQKTLLEQEDERQRKFAQDVEDERMKHDPTYNPNLIPPIVTPTPVVTPSPVVIPRNIGEDGPILPEVTPVIPEIQKKQRDFKTAALIAGVVVGGAAGILGGTTVGIPVAAAAGVVSIGGRITNFFLNRSLKKIGEKIEDPTLDVEEKEKLQKKEANIRKIQNVIQHITKFATGAAIGAGIGNLISHAAMGGHGLIWNRPEVPTGIPGGAEGSLGNMNPGQVQPTTPTTEAPLSTSPETYPGNSFIHDGRVDLPGSAWDGNLAGGPAQDTLPGGMENFANYSGGPSEMAANQLGQDLASNNITDQLLSNLTTSDKHRLLTRYWDAIRGGNSNPELIETLKRMNTEGAQKLLAAIGK